MDIEKMKDDFNWLDGNSCIVLPPVEPIAVYCNGIGDIVVRKGDLYGDDRSVVIPKAYAVAVADAIKNELVRHEGAADESD